jgi:hypothetical protein
MKFNWGIGIATAYVVFVIFIIACVVKASQQQNDLVNDNYYNEAVNYQAKINAMNNTAVEGSTLSVKYILASNSIKISSGIKGEIAGNLSFYKPDNASADFSLDFTTDENGNKEVAVKELAAGLWKVNARWKVNGKDCFEENNLFVTR